MTDKLLVVDFDEKKLVDVITESELDYDYEQECKERIDDLCTKLLDQLLKDDNIDGFLVFALDKEDDMPLVSMFSDIPLRSDTVITCLEQAKNDIVFSRLLEDYEDE